MTTRRLVIILAVIALLLVALPVGSVTAAPQAWYTCAAYYQVKPGDNLYRISLLYNVSQAAIMAANGITNPDLIYAGQSLCIPGSTPPPPAPRPPCGTYYTVQYGDSMSSIAARYGVTMQSMMYANNIINPNYIYAGMTLCVSTGTPYPPPYPPPPPPPPQPSGGFYYYVQPGDTLYHIGVTYGWSYWYLASVNHLPNPNCIYAGMRLWIPAH